MHSSIAMGIIRIPGLRYEGKIRISDSHYLRTSSTRSCQERA